MNIKVQGYEGFDSKYTVRIYFRSPNVDKYGTLWLDGSSLVSSPICDQQSRMNSFAVMLNKLTP